MLSCDARFFVPSPKTRNVLVHNSGGVTKADLGVSIIDQVYFVLKMVCLIIYCL